MRQTGVMSTPTFVTITELAERVHRSRSTVHRDVIAGYVTPVAQLGGQTGAYLFTSDEADRYADSKLP